LLEISNRINQLNIYTMENLQEFMLVFRMEPSNEQPTPEQLEQMGQSWGAFIGTIAMQGKLVSTHQLGFEGKQITPDNQTHDGFVIADKQMVAGNMVIKAENIDVATEWGKKCPILLMGGTVEVRSTIPMN
jgi:hypothetical protein